MNFVKKDTLIPGCYEIVSVVRKDDRGFFVKTLHAPEFKTLGLKADFPEEFYSFSRKGVLRGLHFQRPPAAHAKLVCCQAGEVLDAVLDLRKKSPTFGKSFTLRLSPEKGNMLYIPAGCAHGFYAVKASLMLYKTSTVHYPENDAGILWNSAGIKWPCRRPLISPRDSALPGVGSFKSPF